MPRNKILGANAKISTAKAHKKSSVNPKKIKYSGWAVKLGLHRLHKFQGRKFKRGIKNRHSPYLRKIENNHSPATEEIEPVNVWGIVDYLLKDYSAGFDGGEDGRNYLKELATAAAFEAVRRHRITPGTLDENRTTIENYVQYALYLGKSIGGGKNLTARKINLNGLLDDEGRLDLLKVLQQEAEVFGLEAELSRDTDVNRRAIKPKLIRLLESGVYNHPSGIYFLTERLREILDAPNLDPELVYDSIPKGRVERNDIFPRPAVSLETVMTVRKILNSSTKRQMQTYGRDVGLYLLAKKVRDLTGEDVSLPALDSLLLTSQHITSLMGTEDAKEKVSRVDWRHHHFGLSLNQIESVITFLRNKYQEKPDEFFRRYGVKTGDYNIASDLKEELFFEDLGKLHTLTGKGSVLAHIIGAKDERFAEWNHQIFNLNLDEVETVISHLSERYMKKPDLFFRVYGSNIAPTILVKELQILKGVVISQEKLSELLSDRNAVQELLGFKDEELNRWNVTSTSTPLFRTEQVIDYLRERYHTNPDRFFFRYGDNGYLVGELKSKGIEIKEKDLENLISDGVNLSLLIGVKDPRFSTWRQT